MLHLFPDLLGFWSCVSLLAERIRLAAGLERGACACFPHGSSNEDKCLGVLSPPQCSKFSGKYSCSLPPKLFQSPSPSAATSPRAPNAPALSN